MDAVGLEAAVIVGHSMGTTVAQRFAIDFPERTLGLVLAGAIPSYRRNTVIMEYWESVVSSWTTRSTRAVALEFQESTLARPIPPEFLETAVRES